MNKIKSLSHRWRWIFLLSGIYISRGQRKKTRFSSLLSWLGIAVSVATLVAVLAVMNGFQGLTIDPIIEVSSFHIRVYDDIDEDIVREIVPHSSIFPVVETRLLVGEETGDVLFAEVRGLPDNIMEIDKGFATQLEINDGKFALDGNSVVVGKELAFSMGLLPGDEITFITMVPNKIGIISPVSSSYRIAGLFRTGNYAIDNSFVFMSIDNALNLSDAEEVFTAIKLIDSSYSEHYADLLRRKGYDAHSFSDYNRALFSALRMEKTFLVLLVGFIFLVIGLNLIHSFRRSIFERRGELALLMAIGARERDVRFVFLLEGLIIGVLGSFVGVLWGYFLSLNMGVIFELVELSVNTVFEFFNWIAEITGGNRVFSKVSIFSPTSFYISGIPYKVKTLEVFFVVLYASFVSGYAAFSASNIMKKNTVTEVLRNE
ncbi:ABC transporter permease [Spirochaetia bacterium 38H-sp]|uniref:ABC transporter permease n=1 Tax=Rarispira pelagica TaxID=3141764 RepID=A0ABU9UDZ0_9SPIR